MAGGYAYQDAYVRSTTVSAREGATVGQVPHHTFSLWNTVHMHSRLSTGLGVIQRSDMFAAIDNTVVLPGYVRVDAAAYFVVDNQARLQLNIENLDGQDVLPERGRQHKHLARISASRSCRADHPLLALLCHCAPPIPGGNMLRKRTLRAARGASVLDRISNRRGAQAFACAVKSPPLLINWREHQRAGRELRCVP